MHHVGPVVLSFVLTVGLSFIFAAIAHVVHWTRYYGDFSSGWNVAWHSEAFLLEFLPKWALYFFIAALIWIIRELSQYFHITW